MTALRTRIVLLGGVGLPAVLLLAWWTGKRIAASLKKLIVLAERARDGDLSIAEELFVSDARDEIGLLAESFSSMVATQREMVRGLKRKASHLHALSKETAASTEEVANAAEDVAKSEKVVSLIDATAGVMEIADEHVRGLAASVQETASAMESVATGRVGGQRDVRGTEGNDRTFPCGRRGRALSQSLGVAMRSIDPHLESCGAIAAGETGVFVHERQAITMFGDVLMNAASRRFTILCRQEAEIRRTVHSDECCVVCVKESGNIPRVATPLLSSANLPRTGLFQPLGDIDKYGGGRYRADDFEFLIVGKNDFRDDGVPYNVFLSLCAVVERGSALETAELQVNMLGGISLVNCFKASLPNGLILNEENLGLVSGDGSWYLDRVNERIELRVPSKMRRLSESFFKGRILLPATSRGAHVIFGRSENRLRLFINRAGFVVREPKRSAAS